eukprot:gene11320-12333_t
MKMNRHSLLLLSFSLLLKLIWCSSGIVPFEFEKGLLSTLSTISIRRRSESAIRDYFPFIARQRLKPLPAEIQSERRENDEIPVDQIVKRRLSNSYEDKRLRSIAGRTKEDYQELSSRLLSGRWPDSVSWARVVSESSDNNIGESLITHTRFFSLPVWTVNPCRIVRKVERKLPNGGLESELAYQTVAGHLLRGEESYKIRYIPSLNHETVEIEIATCARIDSIFGFILNPFIRRLQDRFLIASIAAFRGCIVR